MAYIKNTWVDQEGQVRYRETQDGDFKILTPNYEQVTEIGTPVNADNMNHIEDGLADTDLTKYNATTTYNAGEWVTGVVNNEKGIYASKVNNNIGNALSNDTYWEKVELGGGRNIGEIVASTIPLTDAELHLLDGSLIQGSGVYSDFVDYIASIYDASANYFCSEGDWQTAVTTYGVCGKFVYDSVNNTVRLPKYSNKIYTQELDANAPVVGNGNALGLTSQDNQSAYCLGYTTSGNLWLSNTEAPVTLPSNLSGSFPYPNILKGIGVSPDPTKSGIIADLSNITASLDGYYYIVVATSTKTNIQVDIDEIATDLNGKADVDLSNVPTSKGILTESYVNGTSWYRVYSDGWCEQGYSIANSTLDDSNTTMDTTIYLLKEYKDTNYFIGGVGFVIASSGRQYFSAKTTSSFTTTSHQSSSGTSSWWTAGYIR